MNNNAIPSGRCRRDMPRPTLAFSCRSSAPAGSHRNTARVQASRSSGTVCVPADGSTRSSTFRATSSLTFSVCIRMIVALNALI